MESTTTNWRSVASAWSPVVGRAIVAFLPLGFLWIFIGRPLWVFAFLWIPLFGQMGLAAMHAPKASASKPFSFCLPGYRESLRRSYFLAALCFGLAIAPLGLIFWWTTARGTEPITPASICLQIFSGLLLGAAFLLCINGDFRLVVSRATYGLVLLASIPLFLLGVIVLPAFVQYPALGILSGGAVCVFMWIRLGDMTCAKRGHRMILEDALERRGRTNIARTAPPWVESVFRRLMEHHRRSDATQYVRGCLYRTFGPLGPYWRWIGLSILGAAVILGLANSWLAKVVFVASGLAVLAIPLPAAFGGLWLPVGRRERYRATVAVAVGGFLLLTGAAAVVVVLTWGLDLSFFRLVGPRYAGIAAGDICLPGVLVPWLLGGGCSGSGRSNWPAQLPGWRD